MSVRRLIFRLQPGRDKPSSFLALHQIQHQSPWLHGKQPLAIYAHNHPWTHHENGESFSSHGSSTGQLIVSTIAKASGPTKDLPAWAWTATPRKNAIMFTTLFSIVLSYLFFVQTESISKLIVTVAIRTISPDLLVFFALCTCSVYVFGVLVVLVFSYIITYYYYDFPYPVKYWISILSGWLYIYTTAISHITVLSRILWSLLSCFCASQFVIEQHPSFIKKM